MSLEENFNCGGLAIPCSAFSEGNRVKYPLQKIGCSSPVVLLGGGWRSPLKNLGKMEYLLHSTF